jgi:hypothetical protein
MDQEWCVSNVVRISENRSSWIKDFFSISFATPPFKRSRSVCVRSFEVTTTMGMGRCSGFFFNSSMNSKPSIYGIIRSRKITPGVFYWTLSSAILPFPASFKLRPYYSNIEQSNLRVPGSSSTTRAEPESQRYFFIRI